jgi:hypothetical protein
MFNSNTLDHWNSRDSWAVLIILKCHAFLFIITYSLQFPFFNLGLSVVTILISISLRMVSLISKFGTFSSEMLFQMIVSIWLKNISCSFQSSSMHFSSYLFSACILNSVTGVQCPSAIYTPLVSVGPSFHFYFIYVSAEATSTRSKPLFCSSWNLIRAQKVSVRFWVPVAYS